MHLFTDVGSKLATLRSMRARLRPRAPIIVVDQCFDRQAPDFARRLDRYANYARLSEVPNQLVNDARDATQELPSIVPAHRNEQLLSEAGFVDLEVFYVAMPWRGWIAFAGP